MVKNLQITVALLLCITIIFIFVKFLSFRIIFETEEDNVLCKWAQFSLNRLPLKSILLNYATLTSFDTAATLVYILLQAKT